jgi:hypothetical protein
LIHLAVEESLLYQLALVTTYARGCRGFATPVQALDSTGIYDAITPHNIRDMSQDFRVWVLGAYSHTAKKARRHAELGRRVGRNFKPNVQCRELRRQA